MKKYAIIDGQNVINVVEYETAPKNPPPGFEEGIIAVQVDRVAPGWTYDSATGQFTDPNPPIIINTEVSV